MELSGKTCGIKELHQKPPAPPPPPPKRILREDVQPLTEGKVRGGMSNATKNTHSRPTHSPPHPPLLHSPHHADVVPTLQSEKRSNKEEILKKVRRKEFKIRCVKLDICPACGDGLCRKIEGDITHKICVTCNVIY